MLLVECINKYLPTSEDAVSLCVTSKSLPILNKYQIESQV